MPTPNFNFPTINQSDTANVPRDLNALATSLDTAFQQTEYQTATVVGAQIRVTKPSTSSRIFFRLTSAINGGTPITVSTDGGSTSVNLTDTEGSNVTMLEKGFSEIVKVGNFFILRSSGISPAQLAQLADKIGSPTVATDTFDTQLSNLQDAKDTLAGKIGVPVNTPLQEMADTLSIGKKWATGTVTPSTSLITFQYFSTIDTVDLFNITVSGLTFTPSIILYFVSNATVNNSRINSYFNSIGTLSNIVQLAQISGELRNNANVVGIKGNAASAYVNSSGFRLPTQLTSAHTWIAFE